MKTDYKNILVIDLAFIGDVVLATPVTRALKEAYPNARITMLTVPGPADVAKLNPYVDEVLVYDKRGKHKGFFGMFAIAGMLKPYKFDFSVCMNFAVRGAVVAFLAGIPERLGYDIQHAGWFLTIKASPKRTAIQHETLNHLEVLKPLGITTENTSLAFNFSDEVINGYKKKQNQYGLPDDGYIVICPIGSYKKKNFISDTVTNLVQYWTGKGHMIYLIGGFAEKEPLEQMAIKSGLSLENVLAGKLSLPELAVFLKQADCLVSVDTGPVHIAQAAGCRTVAAYGPTDPAVWGPRGSEDIILYKQEECSPCWGKGVCKNKPCMEKVSAREIIDAVEKA